MKTSKTFKKPIDMHSVSKLAASQIFKAQFHIASFLNSRTKHVSGKVLVIILLLFTLLFGGFCLYLILTPFL